MRAAVSLACLIAGVIVMVVFEAPVPRALGVLLLVAFVVTGWLAIATPEYLTGEDDTMPE